MSAPTPRIRVVVLNFNGGDLLGRCLDSVAATAWSGELDVVVVDRQGEVIARAGG